MVKVLRIVPNLATADVQGLAAFYEELFGLNILMDQGWIMTLGAAELGPVQISVASQGGNDAPVPDLSVQVEDVDIAYDRAVQMGCQISYPLTDEPWGVRRFFVVDPMGRALNVMEHL